MPFLPMAAGCAFTGRQVWLRGMIVWEPSHGKAVKSSMLWVRVEYWGTRVLTVVLQDRRSKMTIVLPVAFRRAICMAVQEGHRDLRREPANVPKPGMTLWQLSDT